MGHKILKNLKSFLTAILIVNSISGSAFADINIVPPSIERVKIVKKGEAAPFDGLLFPQQKADEARDAIIERDACVKESESLNKSLDIQKNIITLNEQKAKLFEDQNNKLATDLEEARHTSDLTKILWFALGVVATGLAAYGTSKITSK